MDKSEKESGDIIKNRKENLKNRFVEWIKDPYNKIFVGVLIIALVIRLWIFTITKEQAIWFDAAEYMSTAKYWAGIGNMTDIWYYRRGFFWPLLCAAFFKIGLGEIAIDLFYILMSVGTIAVSYFLIKDMFNKKYALFSSIGLTFCWVFLFFTARPSNEIPAAFFMLLSLLFFWKGYVLKQGNKFIYIAAVFFAISALTRMEGLIFIPILLIFIFIKEKFAFLKNKSLWIALLIFILILLPFFIIYNQNFGNPIKDILSYDLGININNTTNFTNRTTSNYFMYFVDLPYNLTTPVLIFFLIGIFYFSADLIFGIDKIFKNENIQKKLFVILWIVIPFLILGHMNTADATAQQRYTMMQHLFFFMITAIPFFEIGKLSEKYLKINKKFMAFLILIGFIILCIPNLIWANQLIENKKTSYYEVKLAGEWIKQNSNVGDMVVTNSFPQISYYSERKIATFSSCYDNPESHKPACSPEEFNKWVNDVKPKFLMVSVFEIHEQWMLNYPQEHQDVWTPVQGYQQNGQPVLIIYEANYKNINSTKINN